MKMKIFFIIQLFGWPNLDYTNGGKQFPKSPKEHFFIVVSSHADKTCIIWDLNRHELVRSLEQHNGPVVGVDIHPYLGDITVIDNVNQNSGTIHLWTIYGYKISSKRCKPPPLSVLFTHIKPGLGRNVICTGHTNGDICIWSTTNLSLLCTLCLHQSPVMALAIHDNNNKMASGDTSGMCVLHEMMEVS